MKAIVAVTKNWGIGKDNQLLISIPEDMKFFRNKTAGAIVIMGRKTLESFPGGRPLKNRVNIVITRDPSFAPEGVLSVHDVDEAVRKAEEVRKTDLLEDGRERETFVIGGASIYGQMADLCDTIYVTKIDADCEADAFFPDLDSRAGWMVAEESETAEHEGLRYRFVTYKNIDIEK